MQYRFIDKNGRHRIQTTNNPGKLEKLDYVDRVLGPVETSLRIGETFDSEGNIVNIEEPLNRKRLRALEKKGIAALTAEEKDEVLELLLKERVNG